MATKQYFHITGLNLPTYCLGDVHGNFISFQYEITNRDLRECNLIILGDIGLGFEPYQRHVDTLKELNNLLKERDLYLYLFRGNHDNASYFNREIKDDDELMLSNIKVLPDYTVLTINNQNILIVGGAVSIDRMERQYRYLQRLKTCKLYFPKLTEKEIKKRVIVSYWENELPFLNEVALRELTEDGINISVVLTHTCPSFCFPTDTHSIQYWIKRDLNLDDDLIYERTTMDNLHSLLLELKHDIKEWVYGHYHTYHQEMINDCIYTTLPNCDERFDAYEILREKEEE